MDNWKKIENWQVSLSICICGCLGGGGLDGGGWTGHTSFPRLETTTRTLGFISICATAAVCNIMTKLTLATSGGVATRQIREYIQNL